MGTTKSLQKDELIEKVRSLKQAGEFLKALEMMDEYLGDRSETSTHKVTISMQKTAFASNERRLVRKLIDLNAYDQSIAQIDYAIEQLFKWLPDSGEVTWVEEVEKEPEAISVAEEKLPWDAHLRKIQSTLAELIYDANEYRTLAKLFGVALNAITITQKPDTDWFNIIDFILENNPADQAKSTLIELLKKLAKDRPLNTTLQELQNWPEKP